MKSAKNEMFAIFIPTERKEGFKMDAQKLTQKSLEAVKNAQNLAIE